MDCAWDPMISLLASKKDMMRFRELPLKQESGLTNYYDFTLMDRYVVYHNASGVFANYKMFDKLSKINHEVLTSKMRFSEKNYALLVPFVIYSVRNELGHPWGIVFKESVRNDDIVELMFRGVMTQLGFTIREEQIKMTQTMLEGLPSHERHDPAGHGQDHLSSMHPLPGA